MRTKISENSTNLEAYEHQCQAIAFRDLEEENEEVDEAEFGQSLEHLGLWRNDRYGLWSSKI